MARAKVAEEPKKGKSSPAAKSKPDGKWFQTGKEGFDTKKKRDAAAKIAREMGVGRFFLQNEKGKDEAEIVFLDNPAFFIKEHAKFVKGEMPKYYTCTMDFGPCVHCATDEKKPGFVCYGTVIDTRSYEDKEGKVHKNERRLFGAKGEAIAMIEDLIAKHKDLRGLKFRVKRYGDKSPACGNSFEKIGKVDLAKAIKDPKDAKPFDYEKILRPLSEDELTDLGYGGYIAGGKSGGRSAASDDDDLSDAL